MDDSDAWIPAPPEAEVVPSADEEVVDGLPVLADVREVVAPPIVTIPVVQAVAAAATGFVAGAATFALARRLGTRKLAGVERSAGVGRPGLFPAAGTRTYVVHVRVLGRPAE